MRKVFDTIADNAANAGIVIGGRPVKPDAVDLRWVSALLFKNGVIEESGVAAAVLNHPATGVAWLANKLAPWGECLEAGEVVLGGSFTRPDHRRAGRHLPCRLRPARLHLLPLRLEKAHHANTRQPLQASPDREARRRSASGSASPTPTAPRSAPAPASTGC